LFFLQNADIAAMWPDRSNLADIGKFLRDIVKRPAFEVDYIRKYYSNETIDEPPCVLGYLQVFVLSNGDVLTGCYPLPPVGNILKSSLREVLESEAYSRQAEAMIRRECPGCTCGIESSLAMKNAFSSAFFHISHLIPQAEKIA
jgi:MoaA/NifB/PqqE/SkfB family radical SAM enzyme